VYLQSMTRVAEGTTTHTSGLSILFELPIEDVHFESPAASAKVGMNP